MTNFRIAALAAALALAAPVSALAYDAPQRGALGGTWTGYGIETTGAIGAVERPLYDRCPMSSAAEGNANQQNFPTKQYGQTTGGNRC